MDTQQKIGILGGGQLGKMLYQAGSVKHLPMTIMEKSEDCPARIVCQHFVTGDITSYQDVLRFGEGVDIITIEIENVNVEALEKLEATGKKVFPQPSVLKLIRDKGLQKMFYEGFAIPTAEFLLFADAAEVKKAVKEGHVKLPFVQKLRKEGYDGRGVQVVRTEQDLNLLFDLPSVVETKVDIKAEISVIVVRNEAGDLKAFPPVQMEFHPTANLVEFLFAPAAIDHDLCDEATRLAVHVAEKLGIVGLLAVEMFVDTQNNVLVNEVAPRPHNSGHHTIEANYTSQYENHLRAITGMPLGSTEANHAAAMVNLLGAEGFEGPTNYEGLEDALRQQGVYVHLYGKSTTKPFRKMGHITIIGKEIEKVKKLAADLYQHVIVNSPGTSGNK
jgi:5-(carboxyamino)imidazole ribonucleotide synthase